MNRFKEMIDSVDYELNNLEVWVNEARIEALSRKALRARMEENYGIERNLNAKIRRLGRKNRVLLREINEYRDGVVEV